MSIPMLRFSVVSASLLISRTLCAAALGAGFLSVQPHGRVTAWAADVSVVATVNGQPIPASRYEALVAFAQRQQAGRHATNPPGLAMQVLNQLIANEVMRQYGAAHGISATRSETDAYINRDLRAYGGAKGLQQHLKQLGLTLDSYRYIVSSSLLAQKLAGRVAPLVRGPQPVARVRHILISLHPQGKPARSITAAQARANDILKQLQHGADFAKLARQYSDDAATAGRGGILGDVYHNQTVPPVVTQLEAAVFVLPLQRPVLEYTSYGFHIVEVLSRGKSIAPLKVQQEAQQVAFTAWVAQQVKRAVVKRSG